ncbi:hypothetical protein FRC96_15290 [Lujinxingia vulgaris]|uniref:RCC1-like domain-containing protein n=1 Tax=Lujinxingia vulgaris TaxID=2600176 RepID=A0A5C6X560_9DELT|nr:hypothetical protein [Lujinxingia vulgaris]TXD33830.1 hypothetical protein FRC96_15290 [Lujinxingia vulgaris]
MTTLPFSEKASSRLLPLILGLFALALGGCETRSRACETNADCFIGEVCTLETCLPVDDASPDADPSDTGSPDTAPTDTDAADTDPSDAGAPDTDSSNVGAPDADPSDAGAPDADPPPDTLVPVAIAAAKHYSCALLNDASLWCWGENSALLFDSNNALAQPTPVKVQGLENIEEVAASDHHLCARLESGAVHCLGHNDTGGLGNGSQLPSVTPVVTINQNANRVSGGAHHSCAVIGTESTLVCWGTSNSGQTGSEDNPTLEPSDDVGLHLTWRLAIGDHHTCAVSDDDKVRCFGNNDEFQLGHTEGGGHVPQLVEFYSQNQPVYEIVAGRAHTCALTSLGVVHCWGANNKRQLGGDTAKSATPLTVDLSTGLNRLAAGGDTSCGVNPHDRVVCWGADHPSGSSAPHVISGVSDVQSVAVGQSHACALNDASEIRCWGDNAFGQLGTGHTDSAMSPPEPVVPTWED